MVNNLIYYRSRVTAAGSILKFSTLLSLYFLMLLPCPVVKAQSVNTISNDGTTSSSWYIGYDSTAAIGIGINQANSIPNNFTLLNGGSAGSETFVSGWQAGNGWKIGYDSSGYTLSIDNLNIRGTLSASELLIDQVRINNGDFLFSSGAKVESVRPSPPYNWFITEDITGHGLSPFQQGDLIICQVVNSSGASFNSSGDYNNNQYLIKRLIYQVTSVDGLKVYISESAGAPANKGVLKKGDTFARFGSVSDLNRQGAAGIYTNSPAAPYIRITDGVNSWSSWKDMSSVKAQVGNLSGLTDPDFGGQLHGYGLYSNNAYIKGKIIVTNPEDFTVDMIWDNINNKPAYFNAPSGAGLFISSTNMGYYNSSYPSQPWRTYFDNMGRFYLSGNNTDYLSWDGSSLNIHGNIYLTNTIPVSKVTGLGSAAAADNLDYIPDGSIYAKVLSTDIQAGHIKLSEAIGTLDDIDNGSAWGKVLATDIQGGHIKLSEATGVLDDIDNGSYSKILSTEIDAGHLKILGSDNTTTVINGGKIQAGSIKVNDLSFTPATSSNIIATINGSSEGLQINAEKVILNGLLQVGGAAADINSNMTTINGNKITAGTITTTSLNFTPVQGNNVIASINSSPEGLTIQAAKLTLTGVLQQGDAAVDINNNPTTIDGSKITTNSITANKLNVTTLDAITANLGNVTAGNITGVTITGGLIQTTATVLSPKIKITDSPALLFSSVYDYSIRTSSLSPSNDIYGNPIICASGGVQANSFYSADGTRGSTSLIGGLQFKDGLFVSGAILVPWSNISSKPTTISGYGISDAINSNGTYTNPSWISTIDNSKLRNSGLNNATVTFSGLYELSSGNWYSVIFSNGALSSYTNYGVGNTYSGTIYVSTNGTSFNKTLRVVNGILLNN